MDARAGELLELIRNDAVDVIGGAVSGDVIGGAVSGDAVGSAVGVGTFDTASTAELVRDAADALARLEAAADLVLDAFDRQAAAQADGLRTTGAWLAHFTQCTSATAARRVRRVRALRQLPLVAERYRNGRLTPDQVDAFVRALNPRTAAAMATDEALLVELAEHLSADQLARELRGWAELVDTEGTEPDPGHADRRLNLVQTLDGTWTGRFDLGAADGAVLDAAISQRAEAMAAADRRTDGPTRTPAQRRADALIDLIRDGASNPDAAASPKKGARRHGPRVELHLTLDAGELEGGRGADSVGGAHLDPTATDLLICDAIVRGVLTDPFGGAVLHRGRAVRTATPAQRVALAIETGGCGFPGCDAPPERCDAHHIIHWRNGGLTDLPNLVLVCWFHHHLLHDGRWSVDKAPDGTLTWTRPDATVLDPQPRRPRLRLLYGSDDGTEPSPAPGRRDERTGDPPRRRADPA